MKNSLTRSLKIQVPSSWVEACPHLLFTLFLIILPIFEARAQKPDVGVTVSSVSSHPTATGTVVTIGADSSLGRAQTWQDKEGFHVVVPDAGVSDLVKSGKGLRVRRVGSAIEILLQTRQGTPVAVQTVDNHLNLTIDGRLDGGRGDSETTTAPQETGSTQTPAYTPGPVYSTPSYPTSAPSYSTGSSYPAETTSSSASTQSAQTPVQAAPPDGQAQVREAGEYQAQEEGNVVENAPEDEGMLGSVFSGTSVAVVLFLAIVALVVVRKSRSRNLDQVEKKSAFEDAREQHEMVDAFEAASAKEPNTAMVRSKGAQPVNGRSKDRKQQLEKPVPNVPTSLFGAYRIDQEVGKLVLGQAHRMDVLASRASDDRRAIEASLIKAIVSPGSAEDERRRAREALVEYGFVARQSASLLLAAEAFDRTSAARSLGEVGSAAALPFLLEALYDVESIVRNQAVVSIGELKDPSAIGALLDMARKHPDVPASLVSRALSACSVEGLGFLDAILPATSFLTAGSNEHGGFDFTHMEPTSSVEELPEETDEEGFRDALDRALSENVDERNEAVKILAQFPVKSAVTCLVELAQYDPESTVRALAVSSLAFIDHESVFPAVLVGMADESREVRAAAARALSRLNFDRSEAYVHVTQTADNETLMNVARACIKAGILSQNLDRLASGDRRQAYEAFTLICLLAKARLTDPVLEAIVNHSNSKVRVSAVQLLAGTGQEYLFDQLQELATCSDMDEEVKTALLEAMYKLEQGKPQDEAPLDKFVIRESEDEFETFQPKEMDIEPAPAFDLDVASRVNELET